jgi:hypothetical protein
VHRDEVSTIGAAWQLDDVPATLRETDVPVRDRGAA